MSAARARVMATAVAVVIAAGLLGRLGAAADRQQAVFRAATDVVAVDVSVRDRARVVTGLRAADFELRDNGVVQEVTDVSYGRLPIDVTVALDVSFSVTGRLLDQLSRAIGQLMADLGPDDRLKLVTFNMRVRRVVDFTRDRAAVEAAVRAAAAGGGTSILDTVSVCLVSAGPPDRRQLVVLFTDGADSMSVTDASTLEAVGQRANTALTVVTPTVGTPMATVRLPGASLSSGVTFSVPEVRPQQTLRRVSADTGGVVIPFNPAGQDLTTTFRRALEEFRSSYVVHFSPRGVERTGYHELSVGIRGRGNLTVRARKGYFVD